MKKIKSLLFAVVLMLVLVTVADASPLDKIGTWLSGTAIAFILTGLLAIGVIAKYTNWISNILIAFGFLCITIGQSTSDSKITKDELKVMKEKWNTFRQSLKDKPKNE
jgi:hypothetical protein